MELNWSCHVREIYVGNTHEAFYLWDAQTLFIASTTIALK